MGEKSVENLFDALYRLTDLRDIFRKTSPDHKLDGEQKEEVRGIISDVREKLDEIEEEMVE